MKKIWSKFLFYLLFIGFGLLAYAFFFDPAASLIKYSAEAPMAGLIGTAIVLLAFVLAKKTGVEKKIDEEAGKFLENQILESKIAEADTLSCQSCNQNFLKEDLQGYVCPNCKSPLLPLEKD